MFVECKNRDELTHLLLDEPVFSISLAVLCGSSTGFEFPTSTNPVPISFIFLSHP